jgi:hypothetical protein
MDQNRKEPTLSPLSHLPPSPAGRSLPWGLYSPQTAGHLHNLDFSIQTNVKKTHIAHRQRGQTHIAIERGVVCKQFNDLHVV